MKYEEIRDKIKTGDCILWKGSGFIQRLIMLFSGKFSHASLVLRFSGPAVADRVFVVEAVHKGLTLTLLSQSMNESHGEAYLLSTETMNDRQRAVVLTEALNLIEKGVEYDFASIFRFIFAKVCIDIRKLFCSEFVWYCWQKAGFVPSVPKTAPAPGDIPLWLKQQPIKLEL